MNYLAKNLKNSLEFPYDVMKIIYEYADPLISIKKQIENKECDLDDIMYKKMIKYIKKTSYLPNHISYLLTNIDNTSNYIFIDNSNIVNINLKNYLLNSFTGYKNIFLWKIKRPTNINGLNTFYKCSYRDQMIKDLQIMNHKIYYKKYSTKQLYKKWLKI
jgi:hypothetical protein